jgi:hypothetical protein
VNDRIKPEDLLRKLRARAAVIQALTEKKAEDDKADLKQAVEVSEITEQQAEPGLPDSLLQPDHLSLFLRLLNSRLTSAIDEIRASSDDLENLTGEVQKNKNLLKGIN